MDEPIVDMDFSPTVTYVGDALNIVIEAGPLSIDARHGPEFLSNRPHGSGDWLLLHFPKPMRLRDRFGEQHARGDACVLFAPGHPQHFQSWSGEMINHYVHLRGADMDALVATLHLPVNEVLYPRPIDFIAANIHEMLRERMRQDAQCGLLFATQAIRLLATLARNLGGGQGAPLPLRMRAVRDRLGDVPTRMRNEPEWGWSVRGMARISGLGPSRFRALCQEIRRMSPLEELIIARISRARYLLTASSHSVSEVAEACGFPDPLYSSRVFRKRVGGAPSSYGRQGHA